MNAAKALLICLLFWASAAPAAGKPQADTRPVWDRLNDALFVRAASDDGEQYGRAELDILFWSSTKHLLTSPSHERAIRVLDEFIRTRGERLIQDPLKRALLQRNLWALFDWSAARPAWQYARPGELAASAQLQRRLVTVIKRLALSAEEIDELPDNYAEAEAHLSDSLLPRGLFVADGAWLQVGRPDGTIAPEHTSGFGGRSVFMVFVKFPDGREQAQRYLKTLGEFVPALVYSDAMPFVAGKRKKPTLMTNPKTPQFPLDTQWALVRRLCLIDDLGHLHPTRLIESIQTRSYKSIPDVYGTFDAWRVAQGVAEFHLDREHAPALRAVTDGERDFQAVHFRSVGTDPFEILSAAEWDRNRSGIRGETLRTCGMCHLAPGIFSVNSYGTFGMAAHPLDSSTVERETEETLAWKSRQFDWGLLQGLWRQ